MGVLILAHAVSNGDSAPFLFSYYMNDVSKADGDAIAEMASDPRFFYVYINNGGRNPVEAGREYAGLCDMALQHRRANQPLPDEYPWKTCWAKGLRDEQGKLAGVVVLLNEKCGETEIGYFLDPDRHGKGLATTMVMSTLKWARENTGLNRLKGDVDPNNIASRKILMKLGLEEAEFHQVGPYTDREQKAVTSLLMKGGLAEIDKALRAHAESGGKFFPVQDAVPADKALRAARTKDTRLKPDQPGPWSSQDR